MDYLFQDTYFLKVRSFESVKNSISLKDYVSLCSPLRFDKEAAILDFR